MCVGPDRVLVDLRRSLLMRYQRVFDLAISDREFFSTRIHYLFKQIWGIRNALEGENERLQNFFEGVGHHFISDQRIEEILFSDYRIERLINTLPTNMGKSIMDISSKLTFDGSFEADVNNFIREFELHLASRQIDVKKEPIVAFSQLALCLKDNAKTYYEQLKSEDYSSSTGEGEDAVLTPSYDKLKDLLMKNFSPLKTQGDRLTSLLKMKQKSGETVDSYVKRFNKAISNTKLAALPEDSEQQKLSLFSNGLHKSLRIEILKDLPKYKTILELMAQAKRLEDLYGVKAKIEKVHIDNSSSDDEEQVFLAQDSSNMNKKTDKKGYNPFKKGATLENASKTVIRDNNMDKKGVSNDKICNPCNNCENCTQKRPMNYSHQDGYKPNYRGNYNFYSPYRGQYPNNNQTPYQQPYPQQYQRNFLKNPPRYVTRKANPGAPKNFSTKPKLPYGNYQDKSNNTQTFYSPKMGQSHKFPSVNTEEVALLDTMVEPEPEDNEELEGHMPEINQEELVYELYPQPDQICMFNDDEIANEIEINE